MLKLNRQLKETNQIFDNPEIKEGLREIFGEKLNDNLFSELKLDDLEKGEGPDLSE